MSYDVWIRYSASTILGWYCICQLVPELLVVVHIVLQLYGYLSFARHHPEQLKQESSSFGNFLTNATDCSDVSDESDIETDSNDDNSLYTLV